MAKDLISGLKSSMDGIFKIRDDLGAVIRRVSFVTRTWSGTAIGDGTYEDQEVEMWPQAGIKDVSQDIRLREGGAVKAGDLLVHTVSKNRYQDRSMVDGTVPDGCKNIEKFLKIGDELHAIVGVVESHLTWTIQARPLVSQGEAR